MYLDSSDDVNYLSNLTKTFNPNLPLIFGGDFNSVLDPEKDPKLNMDLFNRESIPNIRCSEFLATNIGNLGLLDPFRLLKGEFFDFTFRSASGASRLDHVLIPTFLRSCLSSVNFIQTSKHFDHKNVTVKLGATKKVKKPRILDELSCTKISERSIKMSKLFIFFDHFRTQIDEPLEQKCTELIEINNKISCLEKYLLETDDLFLRNLLINCYKDFELLYIECMSIFTLNLDEFLDPNTALILLLNNIKNELFSVSGAIIKARKSRKDVLTANLARARANNDKALILQLQSDLDSINAIEIDLLGKNLPSNDPFWELNSPKEFSKFLSQGCNEKLLSVSENNCEAETEQICLNHFKSIFRNKANSPADGITTFLGETITHIKTLSDGDKGVLNRAFNRAELTDCVANFKTEKSTGLDGITPKLLKEIVPLCADFFLKCFNDNYLNGKQFDKSLKSSYIRLIPKAGKDLSKITNWRPITIISTVNKLYCKLIYNRLEPITDKILEEGQCAYRPSCDMSDVFLNLKLTVESFVKSNDSACLLSLDFSKAFDSINHTYILEMLRLHQFPTNFINAIKGYLTENVICLILDSGKLTKFFEQLCGTGQGNPLSALIFILAVNVLIIKLNYTKLLSPMTHRIMNKDLIERRCGGYADDIGVLLNKSGNDLANLEKILEDFGELSGLKLNKSKTEVCPIIK